MRSIKINETKTYINITTNKRIINSDFDYLNELNLQHIRINSNKLTSNRNLSIYIKTKQIDINNESYAIYCFAYIYLIE